MVLQGRFPNCCLRQGFSNWRYRDGVPTGVTRRVYLNCVTWRVFLTGVTDRVVLF